MSGFRWRVGALCAVLSAAVISFSLQPAGIVTAEDKNDKSSLSDDKVAADDPETSADDQAGVKEKKPASKKTKKDARSEKSVKKKSSKKSPAKSSRQPATAGQGSGTSIVGSGGAGYVGGLGGNTQSGVGGGTGSKGGFPQNNGGGPGNGAQGAGMPNDGGPDPKEVERVMTAQERHTEGLMKQEGVVGTATGLTKDGRVVIRVYTSGAGNPAIPAKLDGIDTDVVLTGPIRPLNGFAGSPKFDPKKRQQRPVPIGVSSINEVNPSCSGSVCSTGTIGCRLRAKDGSGYYALSNNHVFANENSAQIGNTIVQPGPADNDCNCAPDDVIGQLYKFKPVKILGEGFNVMDAAIIKTTEKLVSNSTLPDGYGAPRTFPWKRAFLGQKVMKYGRTTGFTKGTVVGVNVFALVIYDAGLAVFFRQVEIVGDGGLFSAGGDSGSLVVDRDRFPVGLLFAGAGAFTTINPIQDVLDEFGMEIDGDDSQDFVPPGKIGSSKPE